MANKICTISIGIMSLDNEYTFYDDGNIERFYDEDHHRRINRKETLKVEKINDAVKEKLISNCPREYKEQIINILRK